MGYKCNECGSTDSFTARQEVTVEQIHDITIDSTGNITNWGDSEDIDSDAHDSFYDIECAECGSSNIDTDYEEEGDEEEVDDAHNQKITLKTLLEDNEK